MKRKLFLVLTVLSVMLVSGCTTNGGNNEITPIPTPGIENREVKYTRLIEKSNNPVKVDNYEPMGRFLTNVINDEKEDKITLYTSAMRDKRGNMMWDDTQNWVLQVETEDGVYDLYDERIHGFCYVNVSDYYHDQTSEIVISLYIESNAFNEVRVYRVAKGEFIETIEYSTNEIASEGISKLYSSVPDYE